MHLELQLHNNIAMQLSQILENVTVLMFEMCYDRTETVLSLLYYGILKARLIKTDDVETRDCLVLSMFNLFRSL